MPNHVTLMREDRLSTVAEHSTEESERTVGVVGAIGDVPPSELSTIVLGIELHSVSDAQGLGNQAGEHLGDEDDEIGRAHV